MTRVVMLGPAPEAKGGVSSYVRGLMDAGLAGRVSLRYIPTLSGEKKARKLLAAAGGYIRFLFALARCDVVHAHMSSRASYRRKAVFVSTASLFGKKIVLHMHGGEFDRFYRDECDAGQQARIRRTLARADVVIALSDTWRAFYATLADPARVVALPNAVLVPAKACEENRGTDIVFLGKICPQKGVDTLARAFARIANRCPDACLWLCGDGDPAFVDALGLDPSVRGRIRLTGWL
nr:glycosyltransferase family 4 protein [Clostridia bacterium]